jgi:nucleoside-diphosphate-sugar epimerase
MVQSSVKRLIHVSSLVVYDWARLKAVMDEKSPIVRDIYGRGGYAIAKVWQERVIFRFAQEQKWELSVMRPGFVWGPQHAKIGGMGRVVGRTYVMFGPFTRLPLTHVANCADCLVAAVENRAAVGEVFNVIDGDQIRVWRYVSEYAKRAGQSGVMFPLPYYFGFAVAGLASLTSRMPFGKKAKLPSLLTPRRYEAQFKPIRYSNRKLKEKLGWTPPLKFEQCLTLTYVSEKK